MKTTKEAAAQYCCVKISGLTITYSQKRAHYPHRSQNIAFFQLTVVDGPGHCLSLGLEKYLYIVYISLRRCQAKNGAKCLCAPSGRAKGASRQGGCEPLTAAYPNGHSDGDSTCQSYFPQTQPGFAGSPGNKRPSSPRFLPRSEEHSQWRCHHRR